MPEEEFFFLHKQFFVTWIGTEQRYLLKRGTTWNNLQRPTTSKKWPSTTYNNLQRARNNLKQPTTTYNEQETTWKDLQRVRNDLKWPITSKTWMTEHTYNEQRKDTKRPTTSRFSNYFTIWDKRFTSLIHFPPNIWL